MPWQSNSGGGGPWGSGGGGRGNGGGQGPWGSGGGGGGRGPGGNQPPNVEEMVRQSQEKIKRMMPGGGPGGIKMYGALAALGIAAWLGFGGVYTVEPNQQGVELLFGKLYETTDPGIHYNFPAPIGEVLKPAVTDINQVEVGYRSAGGGTRASTSRDVTEESLMLTGDENIIDIQTAVFWVISDAGKYLFNTRNPDLTVKNAAEAALREVIGKTGFEYARTNGRADVTEQTKTLIQQILDDYDTGILVQNVQLQKIDPPKAVIDAFRDVQAAEADRERAENEAQAYYNEKTEKAVGLAEQILRDAEAYKEERINQASGDAQRFLSVYEEYKNAKDVTKRRIYLQTMEEIMQGMNKVLIEGGESGSGVLPYLPLNELTGRK